MVVAVEMVGSYVGNNRYVGVEIIGVVELERTDFQYIVVVLFGCHLHGVTLAYVASQPYVQPCVLQQVVNEGGSGGLAVGAGNADFLRSVVTGGELYLGYDAGALRFEFAHKGGCRWYAGALHHLVGIEHKLLAVTSLLEGNVPFPQSRNIFFLYR